MKTTTRRTTGHTDKAATRDVAAIWGRLVELPAAKEYRDAFQTATGLAVRYLPADGMDELQRVSGPFCAMIGACGMTAIGCARKARVVRREPGSHGGVTCVCCVGDVTEVVVPVFIGTVHAGNLVVGPFTLRTPTARDFSAMEDMVWRRDPAATPARFAHLRNDLQSLPVITLEKYRAAATLAGLFAQHLSESGNRLLLEAAGKASPVLQKIQNALDRHHTDVLPLAQLAKETGFSPSQLCKQFKKETGLTLGEYRLRRRIERAKDLLLNHRNRVCEAAFSAGFGSIPHFNRAFRRLVGCAPSEYRRQGIVANEAKNLAIEA